MPPTSVQHASASTVIRETSYFYGEWKIRGVETLPKARDWLSKHFAWVMTTAVVILGWFCPALNRDDPASAAHFIFLRNTCTSRHQQNRGYGILLLCKQFSHGLVNSAMEQIPCSTEGISCFQVIVSHISLIVILLGLLVYYWPPYT